MTHSFPEVETPDAEVEDVEVAEDTDTKEKAEKAPAKPKRGNLPEGFVTPVQLAKVLTERGLHTNRAGDVVEVRPQMVYSYIKNAPKDDRLDPETIQDDNGVDRSVLKLDEAIAWWERKNARVDQRHQNAANKATKKAEKKESAEAEASTDEGEAEEAE